MRAFDSGGGGVRIDGRVGSYDDVREPQLMAALTSNMFFMINAATSAGAED